MKPDKKTSIIPVEREVEGKKLLLNRDNELATIEKIIYFSETKTGFLLLSLATFFIYPIYYYFLYFDHKTFNPKFYDEDKYAVYIQNKSQEKINKKVSSFYKKLFYNKSFSKFKSLFKNKFIANKISIQKFYIYTNIVKLINILFIMAMKPLKEKYKEIESLKHTNERIEDEYIKDIEIEDIKTTIEQKITEKFHEIKESNEETDFKFADKLKQSLKINFHKKWKISYKKYDFYLIFIFAFCYVCVSIVTFGIFPLHHLHTKAFKKHKFELLDTNKQTEYLSMEEFNEKIYRLTNKNDFDKSYSEKLISSVNTDFKMQNSNLLFRTWLFKHQITKFLTILFLMIITGGLFGFYLLTKTLYFWNISEYKSLLKKIANDNRISELQKTNKKWKVVNDFKLDLKIATNLVGNYQTKSESNLSIIPRKKEDFLTLFIRIIASPIFKWLFTLFLLLSSTVACAAWITLASASFSSFLFIISVFLLSLLFIGLSYHIFLLL